MGSTESLKILPVLVCRKGQVEESFMKEKIKKLRENLKINIQVLDHAVVNEKKCSHFKEYSTKANGVLLYKPHLGLGDCIIKISEYGLPTILFSDEGMVKSP